MSQQVVDAYAPVFMEPSVVRGEVTIKQHLVVVHGVQASEADKCDVNQLYVMHDWLHTKQLGSFWQD